MFRWSPAISVDAFSAKGAVYTCHRPHITAWNDQSTIEHFLGASIPCRRSMDQRPDSALFTSKQRENENSNMDKETSIPSTPLDRPILSLVDAVMIVSFAAVGKASHSTVDGSLDLVAVVQTAAPFLLSWFAVSPLLGCFTPMATGDWKASTITTTKAWILAIPLGCVLRGIIKGYVPPIPFVVVTLIATWVLLVGGRSVYTILSEVLVETF